ncbi:chondroitin sulfate proteoglycan 5b isoform X2 [Trichomycterus rosablanca]|uniref:chondroitin sulfate proteoglycan 5b isoform X2 n=1 Tax=Trichomycterus rosablanca TaxID=2290929 RepID=UPI002F350E5C
MNYRWTLFTPTLLSSILLLYTVPLCAHGSILEFYATKSATYGVGLKPVVSGETARIALARKPRSAGKPGISGLSENWPSTINSDSAEQDRPIDMAVGGMGAGLPTLSHGRTELDFKEESSEEMTPLRHIEILQPDGSVLGLDRRDPITRSSHDLSLTFSEPDDDSHAIKVDFSEPDKILPTSSHQPQELQGGDLTSWGPVDMEDEDLRLVTKAVPSKLQTSIPDDDTSGGFQAGPRGAVDGLKMFCPLGFVYKNGTCQSVCDIYTSYCFNGGQCYVVNGIGAFCRCNMQDYIWNKGTRCESVITEFQVMCIVVAGVSITLLILFMVTVFFSKQLHLLKIENRKLRKRSKSRPQSELHNDNFSLSTIAEGSQANDVTSKPEEPAKTPTKEDESLNIQNSHTTKHEDNMTSGEENAEENGVTIDLELLLPKEAKEHPETSPPLHYNVFLYKLPKSPKISQGRHGKGNAFQQMRPRRGSEPGYSPISARSLPPMPSRNPNPRVGKACTP